MSNASVIRNAHFLGTKIRNLRKRNNLTMEDLSARCVKLEAESAPSVSYLSMIERGKRHPSARMLSVIAEVFQKEVSWFLDNVPDESAIFPDRGNRGGMRGMSLELDICTSMGLKIEWFVRPPADILAPVRQSEQSVVRSYFEAPSTIHINKLMQSQPARLKYDLALYIGHKVLHDGDGIKSVSVTGPAPAPSTESNDTPLLESNSAIDSQDIVHAWRDFECSFFAGALLCPKVPFRRLLEQRAHDVNIGNMLDVTTSVVMRRMTVVSSYPHWHYFDAYPPGRLLAVYRGNGIPLPWGNMRMVQDPCQHWAVFRMAGSDAGQSSSQVSVMDVESESRIFCCESVKVDDMTGSNHGCVPGLI